MQFNRFLIPLAAFYPRSLCKWLGLTPSCRALEVLERSCPGAGTSLLPWGMALGFL